MGDPMPTMTSADYRPPPRLVMYYESHAEMVRDILRAEAARRHGKDGKP